MSNSLTPPTGYIEQLHEMHRRFVAWCAGNGDKTAQIQFNFPKNVAVVATIQDALQHGLVSCNADGRELILAMCDGGPCPPTVLMVRLVIEAQTEAE